MRATLQNVRIAVTSKLIDPSFDRRDVSKSFMNCFILAKLPDEERWRCSTPPRPRSSIYRFPTFAGGGKWVVDAGTHAGTC